VTVGRLYSPQPKVPSYGATHTSHLAQSTRIRFGDRRFRHPETNKLIEFVVLGFRRDKQRGVRYAIAYLDNEDVEVELNEDEMTDLLDRRVPDKTGEEPELW